MLLFSNGMVWLKRKKGAIMSISLIHKNHYIAVSTTYDNADKRTLTPIVEIKNEDAAPVIVLTNKSFRDASAAEWFGLELGKNWVDKR